MTATLDSTTTLDINQIKALLPHRYPFLLVDRVTYFEAGVKAHGYKNLTANEEFFQGHFPGKPIMPGVLMVEALAQLACVCMLIKPEFRGKLGLFTGIDGFKFKSMAIPGDKLEMEVELLKMRGPVGKLHAIARIDGKLVCEGDISFAMVDNDAQ